MIRTINLQSRFMKKVWLLALVSIAAPLIAMEFTDQVNWAPFDFVAAFVLIVGFGLTYEIIAKNSKFKPNKKIIASVLAIIFLLIWAQLAVGIF